jgi:hypothetical protein
MLGERAQRGVAEHDVRGHALLARGLRPPRPQRLEQVAVALGERPRRPFAERPPPEDPARVTTSCRSFTGVVPASTPPLAR